MKSMKILPVLFLTVAFLSACEKDEVIDTEKPVIDLTIRDAFPVNCDTLYFGEAFEFRVLFSDNVELGSYSIDIHHNFDHHSHSTEVTECNTDPIKEPVNPFVFIEDYAISERVNELETDRSISIPAGNGSGLYDEGDYHFFIRLTDQEGWSTQKGLSIKMFHR